jgi:hypothetical protein
MTKADDPFSDGAASKRIDSATQGPFAVGAAAQLVPAGVPRLESCPNAVLSVPFLVKKSIQGARPVRFLLVLMHAWFMGEIPAFLQPQTSPLLVSSFKVIPLAALMATLLFFRV